MKSEKILCINRDSLFANGYFLGFSQYLAYSSREYNFVDRTPELEANPQIKQLIPYVAVLSENGNILDYIRGKAGCEGRLHNLYSIGFGGHVKDTDTDSARYDTNMAGTLVTRAAIRELKEELKLSIYQDQLNAFGFINDDANEVGAVHLGICYLVKLFDEDLTKIISNEPDIEGLCVTSIDDAYQRIDQFETWSQYFLRALYFQKHVIGIKS